ncbi:hypothetical protein GJU93_10895 [Brucella sp. 10RB9212]|uniref:DUF6998 domain-containing protein n=1 Tax=unclassified Brucella TaxID=2632610 RepID=UPI0012AE63AE|nr:MULTISPECIES: hypothetical protein [unclassified Brucella]MRN47097.1 hypothetical protein [Brucella sp. 10RB9212]
MDKLELPHEVKALFEARNQLRDTMNSGVAATGSEVQLKFTLDGNLVGDIGEALSVIHFGIKLVDTAAHPGIDGFAPDGRSVQVKATGTGRGAALEHYYYNRNIWRHCPHLLYMARGGGKGAQIGLAWFAIYGHLGQFYDIQHNWMLCLQPLLFYFDEIRRRRHPQKKHPRYRRERDSRSNQLRIRLIHGGSRHD